MTPEMQQELWRMVMTFSTAILTALAFYIVKLLKTMAADLDRRAALNVHRDRQRDEVQENVRRIANGMGLHSEEPNPTPSNRPGGGDDQARSRPVVVTTDPPRTERRVNMFGNPVLGLQDESEEK